MGTEQATDTEQRNHVFDSQANDGQGPAQKARHAFSWKAPPIGPKPIVPDGDWFSFTAFLVRMRSCAVLSSAACCCSRSTDVGRPKAHVEHQHDPLAYIYDVNGEHCTAAGLQLLYNEEVDGRGLSQTLKDGQEWVSELFCNREGGGGSGGVGPTRGR